jgi:serine protease Do
MRTRAVGLMLIAACVASGESHADGLDVGLQKRVRAATFEVVMPKLEQDSLSYEKPLPLDLIPFQQRTDRFTPTGTAFAIGPNLFVSAAHVFSFVTGSQLGAPRLRDASGTIYEIDRVLKFADHEDFIVFTLKAPPKRVSPLVVNRQPTVNEPVFAVGNALGEGIVIRDGLFTSETPEPLDGKWKYLRFSAAASPGNSGGPLLDDRGRVIGIVARKSPSENLNMAVPVALALDAAEVASTRSRSTFALAFMLDVRERVDFERSFELPLGWAEFAERRQRLLAETLAKQFADYSKLHADKIFPAGEGSARVLYRVNAPDSIGALSRNSDGIWNQGNIGGRRTDLGRNGYVEIGAGMLSQYAVLRRPDDVSAATLAADGKLFMDSLLKGIQLRRFVGADGVRVTSLGAPREDTRHTDRWGRQWQVRRWNIEHNDTVMTTLSLPTPQGHLVMYTTMSSAFAELTLFGMKFFSDYTGLAYSGTLAQWDEYLKTRPAAPPALAGVEIASDASGLRYRSPRLSFEIPTGTLRLTPESVLTLRTSFVPTPNNGAAWEIAGVTVRSRPEDAPGVFVSRRLEPPASLPDSFRADWRKIAAREHPWTGAAHVSGSSKRVGQVASVAPPAGAATTASPVYTVEYVREPDVGDKPLEQQFKRIYDSVRASELGAP